MQYLERILQIMDGFDSSEQKQNILILLGFFERMNLSNLSEESCLILYKYAKRSIKTKGRMHNPFNRQKKIKADSS